MADETVSNTSGAVVDPGDSLRFLAAAGELLSSSLDYRHTLGAIAQLAVPRLADFVVIDLLQPDGSVRREHAVHVDPERARILDEIARFSRVDASARTSPTAHAIATGQSMFIPEVPAEVTDAERFEPEHLEMIRQLDIRSLIAAPLIVRERILGALTLGFSGRAAHYQPAQVDLVLELARRAAVAVDHALIFAAAEEARRQAQLSEDAIQMLIHAIDHVIIEFDAEGRYLRVAPTAAPLFYRPQEQLVGRTVREVFPTPVAERFVGWIDAALRERRTIEIEYPLSIGGREVWFAGTVSPIADHQEVVWIVRDVTSRKMAEAARIESERRFRGTFEQAAVGITHLDLTGRYLRVNRRFCETLGYTREELLRFSYVDITHPADRATHEREILRVLRGDAESFRIEKRYVHKDGRSIWVALTTSLVRRDTGDPDYFVSVIEDIQARRSLEEQLIRAQKIEAVGRLAGGVAHEFNNALTTITGFSDLVLQSLAVDDPIRPDVEEIARAAWRAAGVANRLMVFSSNQVAEPEVLDLGGVVAGAQRMLGQLIGEDIELITELDPEPTRVHADRRQLEQIVVNLAVNSRDAMPRGGKLRISTGTVRLGDDASRRIGDVVPGEFVRLVVNDSGEGMSPEVQERIFDPFFTTKQAGKGTGLGLSIVYGIVRKAGGAIEVESEVGQGTTFTIYLPLVDAPTRATVVSGEFGGGGPRSARILLVEDDSGVRSLAERVLTRLGHTLLSAANAEVALALLAEQTEPLDLLVTDLVMPGMSGRELAETLRGLQPGLRVLFTSGYSTDQVLRQGAALTGMFIEKPFAPEELEQAVRKVLSP